MELFEHTSLPCPTRYPHPPGSRECTCGQSGWPRSATFEHIPYNYTAAACAMHDGQLTAVFHWLLCASACVDKMTAPLGFSNDFPTQFKPTELTWKQSTLHRRIVYSGHAQHNHWAAWNSSTMAPLIMWLGKETQGPGIHFWVQCTVRGSPRQWIRVVFIHYIYNVNDILQSAGQQPILILWAIQWCHMVTCLTISQSINLNLGELIPD